MGASPDRISVSADTDLALQAMEHRRAGRLAEAEACADEILKSTPTHTGALQFKGALAFQRGAEEEAARLMERSLVLGASEPHVFSDLCEVYRTLGRHDEALVVALRGLAAHPRHTVGHINLSVLRYARGETADAIASARNALALDPGQAAAHFALAEALLLAGDFAEGLQEYEWRYRRVGIDKLIPIEGLPQWNGNPLADGRLIVVEEQGLGDCIQFARYLPWAAERCGELVVGCRAALEPVIAQFGQVAARFQAWAQAPDAAAWIPFSGLPRAHATRLATIPAQVPYLRADPARSALWKARIDAVAPTETLRVGLVWAGKATHVNDRNRSMSLEMFAPLGAVGALALVALQKGPAETQAKAWPGPSRLINLGAALADLDDTMAVLDGLDLVITVDTAIAHLAGAMNRPVWILLPFAPDWRWLERRDDSPWYPSARLFRQGAPGAWRPVVEAVATALAQVGRSSWPPRRQNDSRTPP